MQLGPLTGSAALTHAGHPGFTSQSRQNEVVERLLRELPEEVEQSFFYTLCSCEKERKRAKNFQASFKLATKLTPRTPKNGR